MCVSDVYVYAAPRTPTARNRIDSIKGVPGLHSSRENKTISFILDSYPNAGKASKQCSAATVL